MMTSMGHVPMTWLDALPEEEQDRLRPRFLGHRYRRGESLVLQGDPSANVFVLDSGFAAVRVATAHSESLTVTVMGPGSTFGEIAGLAGTGIRTSSVVALDTVEARVLPQRVFEDVRRRYPAVDRAIAESLALRVDDLSQRLAEAAYETVQRRCGRRLIELAELMGGGNGHPVSIPITQEDLAGLVGATRPTVNQVIGRMSEAGVITLARGRIDVPSRDRLRAFVG
jgi:CRP/FNR family cyclic AMP-dependent transcriptional regulator